MIKKPHVKSTLEEDFMVLGLRNITESNTKVQSLLFNKDEYSVGKAKKWASTHGFKSGDVDVKPETIRLRQRDPESMKKKSFRTIVLKPGIKAVIAKNESLNEQQDYTFSKLELKPNSFSIDLQDMTAESDIIRLNVLQGDKDVGKVQFRIELELEVQDGILGVTNYDIILIDDGVLNLTKDYLEKYFNKEIWDFLDNKLWDFLQKKYALVKNSDINSYQD